MAELTLTLVALSATALLPCNLDLYLMTPRQCCVTGEDELNKQLAELKATTREQKDRIRSLQRELKQRNVDVETVCCFA